ncbi:MAG TPA: tetratricopeptide repeat protein, partial [Cytophagaceae bacterium]|jgi:tetratricopeptide (TPR) repeat protein
MNYYTARNYLKEAKEFYEHGDDYWATEYTKNALIYDNKYADAYLFKTTLFLKWNNYEACIAPIRSAIKYSDEPTEEMYFVYGKCLYKTGAKEEAFPHLLKVYESDPKKDSLGMFIGDIYANTKLDYASAARAYKMFFDNHRNSVDAALGVADAYYKLNKFKESTDFYNIVLRINDENPDALYGIAKCCFKDEGLFQEGCKNALMASKLGNTKADVLLATYCRDSSTAVTNSLP